MFFNQLNIALLWKRNDNDHAARASSEYVGCQAGRLIELSNQLFIELLGTAQADCLAEWYNSGHHIGSTVMIRLTVQADVAEQIRSSDGQVEMGNRLGVVRRLPTAEEIRHTSLGISILNLLSKLA